MKTCIWCRGTEGNKVFRKRAHTFPQSLDGENICDNVCDECNHYFGSPTRDGSSVEVVLKEALNISKYLLLQTINGIPKNKRYKSEFFNIDWNKRSITSKFKYKHTKNFQEHAGRQLRRGLFKVFLEERERQRGDALDERFDFIREFARYNLNDLPVYWFVPKFDIVLFQRDDILKPQIRFTEFSDEMDANYRIFEYHIVGHYFALPTSKLYLLTLRSYLNHLKDSGHPFGLILREIRRFSDVDITFKYLNSRK